MLLNSLRHSALALIITSVSILPFGQEARHDFRPEDFNKLRWIEGTWQGSGGGMTTFYERYHFVNDTTIESESSVDPNFRTISERSTFALRNGRIYDESGKNRWEAARFNSAMAHFVPVKGASNAFQFTRMAHDRWTSTIIPAGSAKRTVYEMRRK